MTSVGAELGRSDAAQLGEEARLAVIQGLSTALDLAPFEANSVRA
jgi:hypothetical protein